MKIDKSHINKQALHHLSSLFLEAKWFYNSIVASEDVFDLPDDYYKIKEVKVKVKDRFETRKLEHISSQMKQEILDRTKDSIRALSHLKEKGRRVGGLRFKTCVNSIPLKQCNNTWCVTDKNHVRIQGIKQKLRVRGLLQIPKESETTSTLLIRKHGDYYLHVTTYQPKQMNDIPRTSPGNGQSIGIDLGIRNQATLSNGIRINYQVQPTARLKRLQRELSRRQKGSKNWYETREKLEKEHERIVNQKNDIRNKLVHKLTQDFGTICYQDDSIKGWMKNYGSKILNTGIGGITCALKQKAQTPVIVPRFYPSTQKCSRCSAMNEIGRGDSIYRCSECGLVIDRDLNAARNIEKKGLIVLKERVPTEDIKRRELTPADTSASTLDLVKYLNNIPRVRASAVEETGSPALIVVAEKLAIFSRG